MPFNGWEMPLYYTSIREEHLAVREAVGLFDVSHMGILTVVGDHAPALLARRTTIDATREVPGRVRYGFWLNVEGAILDDLLLTRVDAGTDGPPRFLLVPNAGRVARVDDLLRQHRRPDTTVTRHNGEVAILAVQGPRSRELLERAFGWSLGALKFYTARSFPAHGAGADPGSLGIDLPAELGPRVLVSRTGYTGELGFELFVPASTAVATAETLVAAGARPCGLGARDTLRLEKGYLLSGLEFNLDRTPVEAGAERFVDLDHTFVGGEVVRAQVEKGTAVRLAGVRTDAPGAIPRHGTPVLHGGGPVATATSGGQSTTLGAGIALAYLPRALAVPDTSLEFEIRGRRVPARTVELPFVPARTAPPRA